MSKASNRSLFFYLAGSGGQLSQLATVKQGDEYRVIIRHAHQPLAEVSTDKTHPGGPLATDDKGSVFTILSPDEQP
ncbi:MULTISPECIES: hypothetical protein [unclassified Pseudomonas]|uniref:hypothetical protein n=1 Tax=unclassified Pseudomonas TaxID=196821 RepID=UPI000A1DB26B|nr:MULTISPECIES: hypothetical protein [unclassified Pseudomonas]